MGSEYYVDNKAISDYQGDYIINTQLEDDSWDKGVSSKADIYTANYNSDCEFFTDVLIKNNVSQDAIICENQSQHTRDNAFLSRKIVDEIGLQQKKVLTKF